MSQEVIRFGHNRPAPPPQGEAEAVVIDEAGEVRALVAAEVIAEARRVVMHRPALHHVARWARLRYLLACHDLDPDKTGAGCVAEMARIIHHLQERQA